MNNYISGLADEKINDISNFETYPIIHMIILFNSEYEISYLDEYCGFKFKFRNYR